VPRAAHAEDQLEAARSENWQRLCVLGFTSVVSRVLAQLPLKTEAGARRMIQGEGPVLWVERDDADLVITVNESRDGKRSPSPDSVEDAVLVDHDQDGLVDRVVDWVDLDRDGRPDRQVLYAVTPGVWHPTRMAALLIEQRDRDRGFWHLVRHQYIQSLCQWRCDFSGNGFFTAASYDDATGLWTTFDENPFCFYDDDEDGWNDEALRVAGEGAQVRSIRWSFDLDHDAGRAGPSNLAGCPYDYDLSLTAVGRIVAPPSALDTLFLREPDPACGRGAPMANRLVLVGYERARDFAAAARWEKVLLAFDENDQNVDPADTTRHERWEGIIADEVPGFPVVGGPPCGVLEKRYELDRTAYLTQRLALYRSPVDRKLHLYGAAWGQLEHDANGDGRADQRLRTEDTNSDGFFDTWFWDGDGDGQWDESRFVADSTATHAALIPLESSDRLGLMRAVEAERLAGSANGATSATQAAAYAREFEAWSRGEIPLAEH